MRFSSAVRALWVAIGCVVAAATAGLAQGAPARFDGLAAKQHVVYLAETIGPRPGGSAGEQQAFAYVKQVLATYGYGAGERYDVPIGNTGLYTGYLRSEAPRSSGQQRFVVGAHVDSYVNGRVRAPGGNDNASGVATVLELARVLAGDSFPFRLELVFFGCEEKTHGITGHLGSRQYVKDMLGAGERIDGLLNIDMIGVGQKLHAVTWNDPPAMRGTHNTMLAPVRAAAAALRIPLAFGRNNDYSDHDNFADHGIPHVWFYRRTDPHYHKASDGAAHVQSVYLQQVGDIVARTLRDLAARG